MFKSKLISSVVVTGLVAPLLSAHAAFAWRPVGVITKQVQNRTTVGTLQDANDAAHAVDAKTGDTLIYSITVRNDGAVDSRGDNDLASVVVTDNLPAGVELISNPSVRTITVDMGKIVPGDKVTKTYEVKVTEITNLKYIENKACFTGNSTVNDNPQTGCDVADIRTNIPQILTPASTTTPSNTTAVKAAATTLPNTGPVGSLQTIAIASTAAYVAALVYLSKKH